MKQTPRFDAYRQSVNLAIASTLIGSARTWPRLLSRETLRTMPSKGARWRRGVHSKSRRIRKKAAKHARAAQILLLQSALVRDVVRLQTRAAMPPPSLDEVDVVYFDEVPEFSP